jgi:hypothetical protein
MLTADELSELENDPDSPGRLWGALVGAMEEHEDGPEKFLALILDARDSLIKVDEVTRALCGKTVAELVEVADEEVVLLGPRDD